MIIILLLLSMVYIFLLNQPVEWNEETAEEQVGAESPPLVADDTDEHSSERKDDDVVTFTEENDWDRLLRMRFGFPLTLSSATCLCLFASV